MYGTFDKTKYKQITRGNGLSQKDISKKLSEEYNIETKLDTVKTWTRSENRNNPSMDRLLAIADMCNCSIQDFFSDAEKKREQIATEEISTAPQKYSNSFFATLPKTTQDMVNNFSMLTEEEQKEALEFVKELVYKGKPT